jgi:hypothetical protein
MTDGELARDLNREDGNHVERWLRIRAGVALYGLASLACGIMDLILGDFDLAH